MKLALVLLCLCAVASMLRAAEDKPAKAPWKAFDDGVFAWKATAPLVGPDTEGHEPQASIKDPTLVRHEGRWHLFATVRFASGKVDTEYLSFDDWPNAAKAPKHILALHDQYYCAPQVFFFAPHKKWYLIYQQADKARKPPFQPCFSTTETIGDPKSWTKPQPLLDNVPEKPKWLDFWVICDEAKAHLFYTSLDGHMWRCETKKADFPSKGWSAPILALKADIFEASHTYKLKGLGKWLTIVEAQGGARRYYKAYLADKLEGPWKPLADTQQKPFAGAANVKQNPEWTPNISHGELLRCGIDENLEIDPSDIRFLFQGASDPEYRGNPYGRIPWRLGILEMAR
jgi:hypothetical protein